MIMSQKFVAPAHLPHSYKYGSVCRTFDKRVNKHTDGMWSGRCEAETACRAARWVAVTHRFRTGLKLKTLSWAVPSYNIF